MKPNRLRMVSTTLTLLLLGSSFPTLAQTSGSPSQELASAIQNTGLPIPELINNPNEEPLSITNVSTAWPSRMPLIDGSSIQNSSQLATRNQDQPGDDPFMSPNDFYGQLFAKRGIVFNEVTGHAQYTKSPIGVDELSITPTMRIGERTIFETLNLEYASGAASDFYPMGFAVHMHLGYIAVGYDFNAPHETVAFHPPFRFVNPKGGVTPFHLDYLFQQPTTDYVGGGVIPINFLEHTTMSRISRDGGANHTKTQFYLLRPDGTKITLAPKRWVPDPQIPRFAIYPMTYWPVSIEKPNGRVITITYERSVNSASGDPTHDLTHNKITSISDDEGRSLVFQYLTSGFHTGFLDRIELHVSSNAPEILAEFTYHPSQPLLTAVKDAEDYVTQFGYSQGFGRSLVTGIVNSQGGATYLNWVGNETVFKLTSLASGVGNSISDLSVIAYNNNIQERTETVSVRSYGSGAIRSTGGDYAPIFPTNIYQTDSVYRDGILYDNGAPDTDNQFAGSLILKATKEYRAQTDDESTWVIEGNERAQKQVYYDYDLVGFWTTPYVPSPHYAFDPQVNGQDLDAGWNYLRYPRLRRVVVEEPAIDGFGNQGNAYLGTVFHYQFDHAYGTTGAADLSGALVEPTTIVNLVYGDATLQTQYTDYHVRELTFSNRIEIDHQVTAPVDAFEYAVPLLTGTLTYYTDDGTNQRITSKTQTEYHATYPFPSQVRSFADGSNSVDTYYTYYPAGSGADSGYLHKTYTQNLSYATLYEDYQWGTPLTTKRPAQSDMEVLDRDIHGNNTRVRENGVAYRSVFDKLNRILRADYPEDPSSAAVVTEYAPYLSPNGNFMTSYRDVGAGRFSSRIDFDLWNREVGTESDMTQGPGGTKAVTRKTYDGLERLRIEETAAGASIQTFDDLVWNTEGATSTLDGTGSGQRHTQRNTTRFTFGNQADFLISWAQGTTAPTNPDQRVDEVQVKDFSGRQVLTGTNITTQDETAARTSTDYRLGGFVGFNHFYESGTQLWRQTIFPYNDQSSEAQARQRRIWKDWLGRVVRLDDPERGQITMSYSGRGLLQYLTEGDGEKYWFLYDDAGRRIETRKRTQTNPELYELTLDRISYHPDFGFIQNQVQKLGSTSTRVETRIEAPDTLGRPTKRTVIIPEPKYWNPVLRRETVTQNETHWLCTWDALGDGSLSTEYLVELKPQDEDRTSLFFANIQATHPGDNTVTFTLDNAKIRAALAVQLLNNSDHSLWLSDANTGSSANTVLDPQKRYRYRVTAIDDNFLPSRPSAWWADLPDLVTDNLDVSLRNNGTLADIDFRIFNGGTVAAPASETRVYLSETFELPGNATPVTTFPTPGIHPGFAELHSIAGVSVGNHNYVIVKVDVATTIEELNESNNLAREFIDYVGDPTGDKPDVVVEELVYSYVYLAGTGQYDTYATYSVLNDSEIDTADDGTSSDGRSLAKLYFSRDNIVTGDDDHLANAEVRALQAGEREVQTTFIGNLDNPVPLHQTHLLAKANTGLDEEPQFDEGANRFNNVGAIELPQRDATGPDLRISGFVHTGLTGGAGSGSLFVTFTVFNGGVWPSGSSQVGFYASSDGVLDDLDTRLTLSGGGDTVEIGIVHPSWQDRVEQSVTLNIPDAFLDNQNYLIVVADIEEEVAEQDENNNGLSHTFQGFSDLVVDASGFDEATGILSFTVRNQDQLFSQATTAQIFIDFEDNYLPFRSSGLDVFTLPQLMPGQSVTLSTQPGWEPPASNLAQYLFVVADPENAVLESNEDNNVSNTPIFVEAVDLPDDKPDLVPSNWGFTDDIWPAAETLFAPDIEITQVRGGITWPWDPNQTQLTTTASYITFRLRIATDEPIDVEISGALSHDPVFGDDDIWIHYQPLTFTEDTDYFWSKTGNFNPPNYIKIQATHVPGESSSINNVGYAQFAFPSVMAVHSVSNQSIVGCPPSTVGIYMSRDNNPSISPGDDLISLYRTSPFSHSGTQPGHMIAYEDEFLSNFHPYDGWYMKIAVDLEEEIDEANETNNVLVVNPDPDQYNGPIRPRGLDPLPNPGPGGDPLNGQGSPATFNRTGAGPLGGGTAITSIQVNNLVSVNPSRGLLNMNYQIQNGTKKKIGIDNLNIFAAYDFGPEAGLKKGSRILVYSSALVGDANGNTQIPAFVSGLSQTPAINQMIRIPSAFLGSEYKLIFVANARVYNGGPEFISENGSGEPSGVKR